MFVLAAVGSGVLVAPLVAEAMGVSVAWDVAV